MHCVQYVAGSGIESSDMARAKAGDAMSLFVLVDRQSTVPDDEDASNFLRVSAFRRVNEVAPVYAQVMCPKNKVFFSSLCPSVYTHWCFFFTETS